MRDDPVSAIYELTGGRGADCTLDATGIGEVRANAIRSTRIWGRACLVGEGGTMTVEPSPDIIHRQLNLYGSWTFSKTVLEELAAWVVEREIPLSDIITHRFTLDQGGRSLHPLQRRDHRQGRVQLGPRFRTCIALNEIHGAGCAKMPYPYIEIR